MKKITLFFLFTLCTATAWAGNITGRVFDSETRQPLIGAVVYIESLHKDALTDLDGRYSLVGVPEGSHTVQVAYVGYLGIQKEVTMSGETTLADFAMTPVQLLGDVVATGQISNQLRALNQQKSSDRIVNVISADQIGSFPDMNIGDALKRVPGVYVSYNEGEADMVNIRGTSPDFSNFTINGAGIPSSHLLGDVANDPTEPWTSQGRGFSIQGIPADMVQQIEVNKTVTADMDGDAIGGSVNLVTRKAPYQRRLSATVAGGYNPLVKGPSYNFKLFYGERFLHDRLGVMAAASVYDQHLGSNSQQTERWNMETVGVQRDGKVEVGDYFIPNDFEIKQTILERLRQSYTLGLDYRIDPNHNLSFTGMYNDYKDWRSQYTFKVDDLGGRGLWKKAAGTPTVEELGWDGYEEWLEENDPDNDGVTADGRAIFDFDPEHPTFYPELERHIFGGSNTKKGGGLTHSRIVNGALGGEHLFGSLKIDWNAAYVKTFEDKPDIREFELQTNGAEDTPDGERSAKTVVMDLTDPRFVNFDRGVDIGDVLGAVEGKPNDELYDDELYLVNGWYLDGFNGQVVRSESEQWTNRIDFELPVAHGRFANTIKFGGKMKTLKKSNVADQNITWMPALDPAYGDQEFDDDGAVRQWGEMWSDFGRNMIDVSSKFTDSKYTVGMMPDTKWIARQKINRTVGDATSGWVAIEDESEPLANSYIGTENVYSAYLMTTQNFGPKFEAIAGLRLEHTVLKFEGTENIVPIGERRYDERADYNSWLPSLNLKYTPTNKTVLRAAYSKTVSRQSFSDIKPSMSVNITGDPRTFRIGNPGLRPWFSHNFDLMAEYYPGSIGIISAGIYHKSIRGFNYNHQFDTPWNDVRPYILDPNDPADAALLDRYVNSGLMSDEDLEEYTEAYDALSNNDPFESQQRVASDARASITGVELAYQRGLDFLPGVLSNLNLYANYTHNWIGDPEKNEDGVTVRLPGTASDALNLSLSYETRRVSARLSYNYTASFLSTPNDADEYRNRYTDAVNYLDLNVDYHIVPNKVILTASANNLLNESTRYYYWKEQYTASNLNNGTRFQLGVILNVF